MKLIYLLLPAVSSIGYKQLPHGENSHNDCTTSSYGECWLLSFNLLILDQKLIKIELKLELLIKINY